MTNAASRLTVAAILRRLRTEGWYQVAQSGSHRQFKHPVKSGRVTVAGKPSDVLPPMTTKSIFQQADIPYP